MRSKDPYLPAHRRPYAWLWPGVGQPVVAIAGGVAIGLVLSMVALYASPRPKAQAGPLAGSPASAASGVGGGASVTGSLRPSASGSARPSGTASPKPSAASPAASKATAPKAPPAARPPACNGCAQPPFAAAAGKTWDLTFDEEFNGSDYDHTKLTPCFDWNSGDCTNSFNNGREHYEPSQVKVSNGTAKLIAAPLSPAISGSGCQNGRCTYKSGLLSTARSNASNGSNYLYKFTYGYVESRFKVPAGRGFFTAFWMLPADPSYHYRNEIDILEMLGDDPSTMFMTYSYNNRSQSFPVNKGKGNNGACAVKDYSKEFVRMGVDWEPNRIAWYIDGQMCAEFTNTSQIENGPMQLILNLMVDVDWQRNWHVGLTDATQSRQLEVDYIHVFQQKG